MNRLPESEYSKVFDTIDFGYRKITVERPLRLNFQASPERIARLKEEKTFRNLAAGAKRASPKKNASEKAEEEEEGRKQQEKITALLGTLPADLFKDRARI